MAAEYGNREIGIIQDALQEIYEELLDSGSTEFRQQILNTLLQGTPDNYYAGHISILLDAYEPLEANFGNLNLETMIDYALANLEVLIEMEQLDDMTSPDQLWTGYMETSEAIVEIAQALNEDFDFKINLNQDIYDVTREISEQLTGSNIKVQDVPMALELQIRTLDDMKYIELGSMYSAFSSTEVMRPFTVQLVEIYNQIENLPEEIVQELDFLISDSLSLKEGPNDYLRSYNNPEGNPAKSVKNVIKYYLEQIGRQQTGYVNFTSVDNTVLDGGRMLEIYEAGDSVAADIGNFVKNNMNVFIQNALEPTQLLNSVRSYQGVVDTFPYQIDKVYMQSYNDIIGTQIINNRAIKNVNSTLEYVEGYNFSIEDFANDIDVEIGDTPTNVVDLDEVISQSDGVDNLNKSKEIMQKNPGMFRKVFNVLEKLDIGDQIITKAVAKGLPAIGLAALSGPVAIAYGAYEMSILLTDAAQAYNKMQTTDEGFWENFGELSDKYSIAYKISKPVYDIILDSLNEDLTEEKDEEILFSFNR
jgi:hypothetical protein